MSLLMFISLLILGAALFRIYNVLSTPLVFSTLFAIMIGYSMKVASVALPMLNEAVLLIPLLSVIVLMAARKVPVAVSRSLALFTALYSGALLAGSQTSGATALFQLMIVLLVSAAVIAAGMYLRYWLLSRQMMKRCHEFNDCSECEMFAAHGG